jgi:hypothetical protein
VTRSAASGTVVDDSSIVNGAALKRQPQRTKTGQFVRRPYVRRMRGIVNVVARLVEAGAPFSSQVVCERSQASRQAVHKHLRRLVDVGVLTVSGKARATRYAVAPRPASSDVRPLIQRVQVASAGSRYRLSARLLLLEVQPGLVEVDFTGVDDLGDEFLDELFVVLAAKHPDVTLRPVRLPARFAPQFFAFARAATATRDAGLAPSAAHPAASH